MKIYEMRAIPKQFIINELLEISENPVHYGDSITEYLHSSNFSSRQFGNLFIVIGKMFDPSATVGFLYTFELLRKWSLTLKGSNWIQSEFRRVNNIDKDTVGKFVIKFLGNHQLEAGEFNNILGDCPLREFIADLSSEYECFLFGATAVLALLNFGENTDQDDSVVITRTE